MGKKLTLDPRKKSFRHKQVAEKVPFELRSSFRGSKNPVFSIHPGLRLSLE
jgi:hypothetical protein